MPRARSSVLVPYRAGVFHSTTPISRGGFDPEANQVVLDLAALYADSDLDHSVDFKTDNIAGCMSSLSDPECAALFSQVGLTADGSPREVPASFIRVR